MTQTYHLEPLVQGDTYPEWQLNALGEGGPLTLQRAELTARTAAGTVVYAWDSAGPTPNITLTPGLATFHAIPAIATRDFPEGTHNHDIRLTINGERLAWFRGEWVIEPGITP